MAHSARARLLSVALALASMLLASGPICGSATDVDAAACCKRHEPCSAAAAGESAQPDPSRCCDIGERSHPAGAPPCTVADAPPPALGAKLEAHPVPAPLELLLADDILEFPPGPLYALLSTYRI